MLDGVDMYSQVYKSMAMHFVCMEKLLTCERIHVSY